MRETQTTRRQFTRDGAVSRIVGTAHASAQEARIQQHLGRPQAVQAHSAAHRHPDYTPSALRRSKSEVSLRRFGS